MIERVPLVKYCLAAILLFGALVLAGGCSAEARVEADRKQQSMDSDRLKASMARYVDKELGVVCYEGRSYRAFSCVKIDIGSK